MAKRGTNLKPSKVDLKARKQEKAARKLEEKKMKGRKKWEVNFKARLK